MDEHADKAERAKAEMLAQYPPLSLKKMREHGSLDVSAGMIARWQMGENMASIARSIGVSRQRVSQIIHRHAENTTWRP